MKKNELLSVMLTLAWIVFIMFILCEKANGQTTVLRFGNNTLRIADKPDLDGWSAGHAMGGIALSRLIKATGIKSYKTRMYVVVAASIFYELYSDGFGNYLLPKGHDNKADFIGDVFFCALGCLMDLVFDYITSEKILINTQGNKVGISIPINGGL